MKNRADIGIIGGSGLYEFFDKGEWIHVDTDYGKPSDQVFLSNYAGKRVAFLPRHGRGHKIAPHKINYRANIQAFKDLGVGVIIAPTAVGSLQSHIKRGDFVLCDDFVDRTWGRENTFFDKDKVIHISSADCYCDSLRDLALSSCRDIGVNVHPSGVAVVVQGPRFSGAAESRWFTSMGWDVVNMTQYPENVLAREAEICYLNISLVTDYDVGLIGEKGIEAVSFDEVVKVFGENIEKLKKVILGIIDNVPDGYSCDQCHDALKGAGA
ncbi:MAG: S-methyl-5'-thioadenosine phosphorylase [Candidatus Portnoybacteria bacterium]|nr:S-methyl-5'-thioadenosine phosphorylase [Candidatus Portnoybacteria bacterium]